MEIFEYHDAFYAENKRQSPTKASSALPCLCDLEGDSPNHRARRMVIFVNSTFSHEDFCGGFIFYPGYTTPQQLASFENFIDPITPDPYASLFLRIGHEAAASMFLVSNGIC